MAGAVYFMRQAPSRLLQPFRACRNAGKRPGSKSGATACTRFCCYSLTCSFRCVCHCCRTGFCVSAQFRTAAGIRLFFLPRFTFTLLAAFLCRLLLSGSIFLVICCGLLVPVRAQAPVPYAPITYKGPIPEEFTASPEALAKEQAGRQNVLPQPLAYTFFRYLNYKKQGIFKSGAVLFHDELTQYVRTVTDNLLENQDELRRRVKVYVVKSEEVNAYAMPDGTLFVNLGLLQRLENESQLAIVLAHEVAHAELQHTLKAYKREAEQRSLRATVANPEAMLFGRMRYSRDNENEADARGLSYLAGSRYNAQEAPRAMALLEDTTFLQFTTKIRYGQIFQGWKTLSDSALAMFSVPRPDRRNTLPEQAYELKELLSTHPETGRRVLALQEMLSLTGYQAAGKKTNLQPEGTVERVRRVSRFELVESLYRQSQFGLSLYAALQLLNDYPAESYLLTVVSKNLYWLGVYRENNNLATVLQAQPELPQHEYRRFVALFHQISLKELREHTYRFMKDHFEQQKHNEDFVFYYALTAEALMGKETGRLISQQYRTLFPNGQYLPYLTRKLAS